MDENKVPLQLVHLGPLIRVKQPQPDDEIFTLFNEESVRYCRSLSDYSEQTVAGDSHTSMHRKV